MNTKKGRQVDSSIAQAYIQMIRNAENFIYIENQYFLGSAYSWLQNDDVNAHHTIPVEIAQKVVEKIYAGGQFSAALCRNGALYTWGKGMGYRYVINSLKNSI